MNDFKVQRIKSVLKATLKRKGLTYDDLAEHLECSVPTVTRILGTEELSLSRLLQLCAILKIDLAELDSLTREEEDKEDRFTPEQELFLSKNKSHFAYLMKLLSGETPKQIAEKYALNSRSTEKYLIALENNQLIRVTGKQKVKPVFKNLPSLGKGPLGKVYFESLIKSAGQFFIDVARQGLWNESPNQEKLSAKFAVLRGKITRESYEAWVAEQEKAFRSFQKLASFEEKSRDPEQLRTCVFVRAHTLVQNDYEGLRRLDGTLGEITNL